jgi:hypothetical protein
MVITLAMPLILQMVPAPVSSLPTPVVATATAGVSAGQLT